MGRNFPIRRGERLLLMGLSPRSRGFVWRVAYTVCGPIEEKKKKTKKMRGGGEAEKGEGVKSKKVLPHG